MKRWICCICKQCHSLQMQKCFNQCLKLKTCSILSCEPRKWSNNIRFMWCVVIATLKPEVKIETVLAVGVLINTFRGLLEGSLAFLFVGPVILLLHTGGTHPEAGQHERVPQQARGIWTWVNGRKQRNGWESQHHILNLWHTKSHCTFGITISNDCWAAASQFEAEILLDWHAPNALFRVLGHLQPQLCRDVLLAVALRPEGLLALQRHTNLRSQVHEHTGRQGTSGNVVIILTTRKMLLTKWFWQDDDGVYAIKICRIIATVGGSGRCFYRRKTYRGC